MTLSMSIKFKIQDEEITVVNIKKTDNKTIWQTINLTFTEVHGGKSPSTNCEVVITTV